MTTIDIPTVTTTRPSVSSVPTRRRPAALATLTRRRFALSASTPRAVVVPLLTPILFALVIAPALAKAAGSSGPIDYVSFVAVGTIGLLVPLSCVLGGIGLIVEREAGAQPDLLAAPVARSTFVFANLAAAVTIASLQVVALLAAVRLSGATLDTSLVRAGWAVVAVVLLAVGMHGAAETLSSRIPKQEDYVGAAPPIALLPWFFAGSFFPITAMPAGLTIIAKLIPLTHALALMRYGLVDPTGSGLHDIWGLDNVALMAALSSAVVVVFAAVLLTVGIRTFKHTSIR
jgi:ABC-type polysaccharide/polyol phosphate export permease